jgi:hypothetical protein
MNEPNFDRTIPLDSTLTLFQLKFYDYIVLLSPDIVC